MIKAVLFDVGGVLNAGGGRASLQELFGIDADYALIADIHQALMSGALDEETFFTEINRRLPTGSPELTREMFVRNLQETSQKITPLYGLAAELREANIATGILSNALALAATELRAQGFYDGFSPVLLSCEQGLAKPDPAFYSLALQMLDVEPHQVAFIDDQQKCLVPAQGLGMHTVLAVSPAQVTQDIGRLLKAENELDT